MSVFEPWLTPGLYDRWITFVFDRPETKDGWYFASGTDDDEFEASREDLVALIGATCERSGRDLARFSNTQVAHGVNYMFNNSCSNVVYAICQKGAPAELRVDAVNAMKTLYADCFARRCDDTLANAIAEISEANRLNVVCSYFWDSSPLSSWKGVVTDVMEFALGLKSIACVESALYGLGHRWRDPRVPGIIDTFLRTRPHVNSQLRQRALNIRAQFPK